ncbi:FAD-dependent oxidoreductase [Candidatus Epulonipiscium viviparus]|uniref:FAD-dependent oxidoreductase n=1 Tax=Candidatus Epulonipiscium viviparus TaxID=420336 RepID=UPI0027381379|nr:FAD-dependent oxidoreductase [Candidatus Epulopiscium viviparus]
MKKVQFDSSIIDNSKKIANECMGEEDAFCQSSCPMNTDVKGYVKLIQSKNYPEAIKVIRQNLFLPNTLGRVCAHPCEQNCRRGTEFNNSIAIAALKRFVAEKADDESVWDLTTAEDTGKSIAIVGAGPAGAQAAINLRRNGHSVTIFEKLDVVGGMMRVGIPEYRLPREVIDFEYSYLGKLGIEIKFGVEIGKDIALTALTDQFDAVLLAHGAHLGNIIQMPGSDAEGVYAAADYLREISFTKNFAKAGKRIMVIGGGDVAMDCARSAWRIGATEVHLSSRRTFEDLRASNEEKMEAKEEGVLFYTEYNPIEILTQDNKVVGIKIQHLQSEDVKTLDVDTIIMATGQIVEDITDSALTQLKAGRYQVDLNTLATSVEKLFVAGDAALEGVRIVEAMALGKKAAISIDRFVSNRDLLDSRDLKHEWVYETKLDVPLPEKTLDLPRLHTNMRPADERKLDFEQSDLGFSEEDAIAEASRCLSCECKLCMKECIMMNDFGNCPKDIVAGLVSQELEPKLAYSCNSCDNCTVVCPKELPMKQIFIDSRKDYVNANNGESPMKGHSSIKMHQLLGFSKFFSTKIKGDEK